MSRQAGTLGLIKPLIGPANVRRIYSAIALAVGGQLSLAAIPLIQQVIVDDAIVAHRKSLGLWIMILVITGVVCFVLQYLRRRVGFTAAARSQRELQKLVHHRLQYLDPTGRDRFRTGDVMSRSTSDLTIIQMFLQQLGTAWGNLTLLMAALGVMLWLSPLLTLVMVVVVPLFIWVAARFRTKTFPASYTDALYKASVRRHRRGSGHGRAGGEGVRAGGAGAGGALRRVAGAVPVPDPLGENHSGLLRVAGGVPRAGADRCPGARRLAGDAR